jgi:hypothetical protein
MRYTPAESHAFKESFVNGDTAGFVVLADIPDRGRRFAEIYAGLDCYYIFEDSAEAEWHSAFAAEKLPPQTERQVLRVTVSDIRDYQVLHGRKTVALVNREGQITQSLRVGDMPLWTRSAPPFPGRQLNSLGRRRPGCRHEPGIGLAGELQGILRWVLIAGIAVLFGLVLRRVF